MKLSPKILIFSLPTLATTLLCSLGISISLGVTSSSVQAASLASFDQSFAVYTGDRYPIDGLINLGMRPLGMSKGFSTTKFGESDIGKTFIFNQENRGSRFNQLIEYLTNDVNDTANVFAAAPGIAGYGQLRQESSLFANSNLEAVDLYGLDVEEIRVTIGDFKIQQTQSGYASRGWATWSFHDGQEEPSQSVPEPSLLMGLLGLGCLGIVGLMRRRSENLM
jgi:hypothetical protein